MILITVGTQKFPLNRLLKEIDELVGSGAITEEVFAQTGNSDYEPKNYEYKAFLDKDEFENAMQKCSMLITHGGVGSIIKGLSYNKPVIVFPRLAEFGEHVDDHQDEISIAFEKLNYVLYCGKNDNLFETINKAKNYEFQKYSSEENKMIETLRGYLSDLK